MPRPDDELPNGTGAGNRGRWSDEQIHDMEEQAYWEAKEEDERREEQEREQARKTSAIEEMTVWFEENFESPEVDTPMDKDEQHYIYPWGGPFDAGTVLSEHFADEYPEAWIDEAVEYVQASDVYEWAPTATGDFYIHQEPEAEAPFIQSQLMSQILIRLGDIEKKLGELPTFSENVGHNQPPEEIGTPPYSDEDKREIQYVIEVTRRELSNPNPAAPVLEASSNRLMAIGTKIAAWLGRKIDKAVDEAIKYGVPILLFWAFHEAIQTVAGEMAQLASRLAGN